MSQKPPESVLIAEDDPLIRQLMGHIMRTLGYAPILAPNGRSALEIATHNQLLACAFVDLMMPEMDGATLIPELRRLPGLVSTPIIVVTASVTDEQRVLLLDLGATLIIEKPVSIEKIRKSLVDTASRAQNAEAMGLRPTARAALRLTKLPEAVADSSTE